MNPNSLNNLVQNRSRKEAEALSIKGGVNSGKARRENKAMRDIFRNELTDDDMRDLFRMLINKAKTGNLRAFEIIRDTMGEKPITRRNSNNSVQHKADFSSIIDILGACMTNDEMTEDELPEE